MRLGPEGEYSSLRVLRWTYLQISSSESLQIILKALYILIRVYSRLVNSKITFPPMMYFAIAWNGSHLWEKRSWGGSPKIIESAHSQSHVDQLRRGWRFHLSHLSSVYWHLKWLLLQRPWNSIGTEASSAPILLSTQFAAIGLISPWLLYLYIFSALWMHCLSNAY